jgi:hypothetical protein
VEGGGGRGGNSLYIAQRGTSIYSLHSFAAWADIGMFVLGWIKLFLVLFMCSESVVCFKWSIALCTTLDCQ